jgi:hypothetical protein
MVRLRLSFLATVAIVSMAHGQAGKPLLPPEQTYDNGFLIACNSDPDPKQMCDPKGRMLIHTPQTFVVRLADEEYANLQKLRQAVVDEEKRLAVKYGWWRGCTIAEMVEMQHCAPPDYYEFHQQFIVIDRSK